jgi:glycosyltransferase involved in cell wall biosynthesis
MKINIVLGHELPFPSKKGGGVNSLLGQLVNEFNTLGNEVTVFSPEFDGYKNFEIVKGVKHIRVRGSKRRKNLMLNFIFGLPYFFRVLKKMEYADVLSSHLWHGFLFSFLKVCKVKTHTVHRDPKKFLKLFSSFDRIYFGSDSVCDDGKKMMPNLQSKFHTIYNCVDFKKYSNPIPQQIDGKIKFLYVGRFSEDKGLRSLFEGFEKSFKFNPNIYLKTVGPLTTEGGSDLAYIQELSKFIVANKLTDNIEIAGPIYDRDELDEEISKHDVIVLPSIYGETLNMVILECMRIGKAQLISDLPANLPLNKDGITGYFCEAGNSNSWLENINKISNDINNGINFGLKTYNYGKEKFSSEIIAKVYISDFKSILEK